MSINEETILLILTAIKKMRARSGANYLNKKKRSESAVISRYRVYHDYFVDNDVKKIMLYFK